MECPAPCLCGLRPCHREMASFTWKPVTSDRGPFQITFAFSLSHKGYEIWIQVLKQVRSAHWGFQGKLRNEYG